TRRCSPRAPATSPHSTSSRDSRATWTTRATAARKADGATTGCPGSRAEAPTTTKGTAMATLRLGDIAPDFTQASTEGKIEFHKWLGDKWGVLFSHPKDFTPVCTTELGYTAKLKNDF